MDSLGLLTGTAPPQTIAVKQKRATLGASPGKVLQLERTQEWVTIATRENRVK
jgi:hypothetical protein